MSRTVKLDVPAFNRGVESVLTLQPLRTVVAKYTSRSGGTEKTCTEKNKSTKIRIRNEQRRAG